MDCWKGVHFTCSRYGIICFCLNNLTRSRRLYAVLDSQLNQEIVKNNMTIYDDQLSAYIQSLFAVEDKDLVQAREEAARYGLPAININAEEGRFLQFLVRSAGARNAVEIGTLYGYSSTWIVRGLMPGGKLITIEKDPKHADIARQNIKSAGLAETIDLHVGDAKHILNQVQERGPFDFVFIDADRANYPFFFEWALEHLRAGGIVAAHNAFMKGSIAGMGEDQEHSALMRQFNRKVAEDARVTSTIFPAGDGTLIAIKNN
jgi:predicted O-methyltransferase YrrM